MAIKFYYHPSPNPAKVALFLEEAGLDYEVVPVDTRKGEQHGEEFRRINPNGKTPAIVDEDGVRVFDSNAILIYLAGKTGKFLPPNGLSGEMLSWLMLVATGVGPYSGQAVHFSKMAPQQLPYAIERYLFEVRRHYEVMDRHLADNHYLAGPTYTIADMAAWGWLNAAPFVLGDGALDPYPNLKRLHQEISARPAAERAHGLREKFAFKQEMDDEAKRAMFPGGYYGQAA